MPKLSKSQQKRLDVQLELDFRDPVCQAHGCMQQQHFKTIRELQKIIANLEAQVENMKWQRVYDK